jgi:hypothetical protein
MRAFYGIALLSIALSGCAKENMGDCFTSTGPWTMEQRSVPDFSIIKLNDRIDLVITQDSLAEAPTVTVEAGRNILPNVVTELRDGLLYIGNGMRCNWVRDLKERPLVRVTVRALDEIVYSGVGDVSATTPIRGSTFRLEQWDGHGTVRLELDVDTCWIGMHTGVGDAVITGRTHTAWYYTANFAHIDGQGLGARVVLLNNSGSGDIRCRASEALFAQVRNVGDVYYSGDPPVLDAVVLGPGRLVRLD